MRVLLVEDDRDLSDALVHILQRDGYVVDVVYDGKSGLEYGKCGSYDALIFDIMLPELDGIEAVKGLRRSDIATPVLMLTAKATVPDKIEGLDCGADSYMTKPFSANELLARLRALTRRYVPEKSDCICLGNLKLDGSTRLLSYKDESIQLKNKEYFLAELFLENPSIILTKKQMVDAAWDGDMSVEDNSVEAYISMLRKKLVFLRAPYKIKSERTIGYRLVDVSDEDESLGS